MRFVPSSVTNQGAPGADAEAKVFERLRDAFEGDRDGIGFYKFPVVDRAGERFDREPDFVILHQDYGLLVIEVKGYLIDHIEDIVGQNWLLQGISQDAAQPFSQARDQGFFIQSHFTRERALRDDRGNCQVPMNSLVALPNITRDEWEAAGHDTNPSARVLLEDDLTPAALRAELGSLPHAEPLPDEVYRAARAVLTGGEVISEDRGPDIEQDSATKGDRYEQVRRGLKELDAEQEEIGLAIPPGPQQIRGIAGSGKTVLLAMKAATMHVKHPDWRIALTFNTRSLYEGIESLVDRFVAHFSDGTRGENLEILHGWGGGKQEGLYYRLALEAGIEPYDVEAAEEVFDAQGPAEALGAVCGELATQETLPQAYDAILVDEGQDFEPGFYRLCYQALSDDRRLIWGYDEAQNLTNLTAPTPSKIFGADQDLLPAELDLTGSYEGNIPKSRVMRRSYRAPRQSLMVAHSMGMALKRPEVEIPRITRKTGWRDIGYEVEGDFRETGEPVTLTRPAEFSPHPLQGEPDAGPFVSFEVFADRDGELEYVADAIAADIEEEELAAEDVLAIPLGDTTPSRELGQELAERLEERGVPANIAWQGNANVFSRDGKVTISRIHRAKGNEAAQVYVLNLAAVERDTWQSDPVQNRNELFVALTRSRAYCTVTGSGETDSVFEELSATIAETAEPDPEVTFPAPPRRDIDLRGEDLPSVDDSQADITDYTNGETPDPRVDEEGPGGDGDGDPADISKIYLGSGAQTKGWIPLPAAVVEDDLLPVVRENLVEDGAEETVKMNFGKEVPMSGWKDVRATAVREQILPLVREHRTDR